MQTAAESFFGASIRLFKRNLVILQSENAKAQLVLLKNGNLLTINTKTQ